MSRANPESSQKPPKTVIAIDVDGCSIIDDATYQASHVLNNDLLQSVIDAAQRPPIRSFPRAFQVAAGAYEAPDVYLYTSVDMTQVDSIQATTGFHALNGATRSRVVEGIENTGVPVKGVIVSAAALTGDPVAYGRQLIAHEKEVMGLAGISVDASLNDSSPLDGEDVEDQHGIILSDISKAHLEKHPGVLTQVIQDWFFSHLMSEIFSGNYKSTRKLERAQSADQDEQRQESDEKLPKFPGRYLEAERKAALEGEFKTLYPQASAGYYIDETPENERRTSSGRSKRPLVDEYALVCQSWSEDPAFCRRINAIIELFNKITWPEHLTFEQRCKIFSGGKGHMLAPLLKREKAAERIVIFDDKAEVIQLAQVLNADENKHLLGGRYIVACQVNDRNGSNTPERYRKALATEKAFCFYSDKRSPNKLNEFGAGAIEVFEQNSTYDVDQATEFPREKTLVERLNHAWDDTFFGNDLTDPKSRANPWMYLNRPGEDASWFEKLVYYPIGMSAELALAFMRLVLVATPALMLATLEHVKQKIYNSRSLFLLCFAAPIIFALQAPLRIMHFALDLALSPKKYWERAGQIQNPILRTVARIGIVVYLAVFWVGLSVGLPGYALGHGATAGMQALSSQHAIFATIASGLKAIGASLLALPSAFAVILLSAIKALRLATQAPTGNHALNAGITPEPDENSKEKQSSVPPSPTRAAGVSETPVDGQRAAGGSTTGNGERAPCSPSLTGDAFRTGEPPANPQGNRSIP